MAEKGGYKHFMQKEIFEQPRAVRDTLLGRISQETGKVFLDEMEITEQEFKNFEAVKIIACGTSWHSALAGKFMIEKLAQIPVEVDYGSEFRYRDPIVAKNTLVIAISQSGETADTLAAQREARQKGAKILGICNVVGSMLTREANGTIYTHAGPEIGVASTKAFTGQLTALILTALYLGQVRGKLAPETGKALMQELTRLPSKIETILQHDAKLEELARTLFRHTDFLYLGRGIHYPIALEGALKLKEISYIHAEGYPAGEMKHGPNALIDENLPVVVIATRDESDPASMTRYEKTISNMQEVKARDGIVVAIVTEGDRRPAKSRITWWKFRRRRSCWRRFWKLCRCRCWRITSRCVAGATWTNRATWRSPVHVGKAAPGLRLDHWRVDHFIPLSPQVILTIGNRVSNARWVHDPSIRELGLSRSR